VTYELARKMFVEGLSLQQIIIDLKIEGTEILLKEVAKKLGWNVTRASVTKMRKESYDRLKEVAQGEISKLRWNQLWQDAIEYSKCSINDCVDDEARESYLRQGKLLNEALAKWGLNMHDVEEKAKESGGGNINIGTLNVSHGAPLNWDALRSATKKPVQPLVDVIALETSQEQILSQ
jgi:hypothetical protein